jgi:hypothetical protein
MRTGKSDGWSRVPHAGEKLNTRRTNSPWPILDRDDDSILVGEPARQVEAAQPAGSVEKPLLRGASP